MWRAVYELQSPEDLGHDLQTYLQDMSPELVDMLGGKKGFYERSEKSVGYWVGDPSCRSKSVRFRADRM